MRAKRLFSVDISATVVVKFHMIIAQIMTQRKKFNEKMKKNDECQYLFMKLSCHVSGQGRVSNPPERGTGGRAPKAPREMGSGEGAVPFPRKFLYFLYKNGAFPVIFNDTVLFKKGTIIKRAGVRTPWTPPGSASDGGVYRGHSK